MLNIVEHKRVCFHCFQLVQQARNVSKYAADTEKLVLKTNQLQLTRLLVVAGLVNALKIFSLAQLDYC